MDKRIARWLAKTKIFSWCMNFSKGMMLWLQSTETESKEPKLDPLHKLTQQNTKTRRQNSDTTHVQKTDPILLTTELDSMALPLTSAGKIVYSHPRKSGKSEKYFQYGTTLYNSLPHASCSSSYHWPWYLSFLIGYHLMEEYLLTNAISPQLSEQR